MNQLNFEKIQLKIQISQNLKLYRNIMSFVWPTVQNWKIVNSLSYMKKKKIMMLFPSLHEKLLEQYSFRIVTD